MEFKLNEYVNLKTTNELYRYMEFVTEELGAEVIEYCINGNDRDAKITSEGICIDYLWIKPQNTTPDNISKIIKVIEHLEIYANVEFVIVDVSIR